MANADLYALAAGFFEGLREARLRERIKEHLRESARAAI
jgi:hypothetical protein